MGIVQSSYSERMTRAYPGLVADTRHAMVSSRIARDSAIDFGLAVSWADDTGVTLGGSMFCGVSFRDVAQPRVPIQENQAVGVVTDGDVWVQVGDTVAAADAAYFDTVTGVFYAADGAGRFGPLVSATFMSADVEGLARLRFEAYPTTT